MIEAIALALHASFPAELRDSWAYHLVDLGGRIDETAAISLLGGALHAERDPAVQWAITSAITKIADQMEPHRRAEVLCERLEQEAHETVTHDHGPTSADSSTSTPEPPITMLATAFETSLRRLKPAEAANSARRAAIALARALEGELDEQKGAARAMHLATMTASMNTAEASGICGPAARKLASRIAREQLEGNSPSVNALLKLAPRLESPDARAVAGTISEYLLQEPNVLSPGILHRALTEASNRIAPIDEKRFYSSLADRLALMAQKPTKADGKNRALDWLAEIAKRLDSAELRQPGNPVIQILRTSIETEKTPRGAGHHRMGPRAACRAAWHRSSRRNLWSVG